MAEIHAKFVHRFVPGAGTTLLLLHGTGGNENDLLPLGKELLPGAAMLSPRGLVLENGMPRFFRRFAEGVFDVDDLKFRTHELHEFITAASEQYGLDNRLVAVGYSNGANIAASLLLLHPDVLAGAILFRAMMPFTPDFRPDLHGVKVLFAPGAHDPVVPPADALALPALLQDFGAAVEVHSHQGGHELGQDDLNAAKKWLAKHFGGSSQPPK